MIPVLLLQRGGLIKTRRYAEPVYVGDPVNAARIFARKRADELILLDVAATPDRRGPDLRSLRAVAAECSMPLCFGGGLGRVEDAVAAIRQGADRVALGSAVVDRPDVVRETVAELGSAAVVACVDYRESDGRRRVFTHAGRTATGLTAVEAARRAEDLGVGEIVLGAIDRDGTCAGYDVDGIAEVSAAVRVPVVGLGGAGSTADLVSAVAAGASAAAAGSLFVLIGQRRAVLLRYAPYPGASE